jgi:hypothetical protein
MNKLQAPPLSILKPTLSLDKIYCIHEVENKDDIREHAKCGDFPADRIEEIKAVINLNDC